MIVLRSLLSVLLLATVLAPTVARADDDDAATGEMMIEMYDRLCPSMLANGPTEDNVTDQALAVGLNADSCACIVARLRAVPAADVADLMGGRKGSDFEQINSQCIALAMKPRIGAMCRVFLRKDTSVDAATVETACTCAQERSDAISDDAFVARMDGESGGLEALLAECEPDTTPVPPKDTTP